MFPLTDSGIDGICAWKLKKSYVANKKLLNKKQVQYGKETRHGTMKKKQAAWEEKINEGF